LVEFEVTLKYPVLKNINLTFEFKNSIESLKGKSAQCLFASFSLLERFKDLNRLDFYNSKWVLPWLQQYFSLA